MGDSRVNRKNAHNTGADNIFYLFKGSLIKPNKKNSQLNRDIFFFALVPVAELYTLFASIIPVYRDLSTLWVRNTLCL
jgi:hypothetical protein